MNPFIDVNALYRVKKDRVIAIWYFRLVSSYYVLTHHIQVYPISLPFIGYDAMGYEMSKPHLRAELEADLKRYEENLFVLLALIAYTCICILYHIQCKLLSVTKGL